MPPEPGLQPGQAVAHREYAVVRGRDHEPGRLLVGVPVLVHPGQHVLPVAGQGQLQQQAGEAAARLEHRDQRAARDVEALEGPLEVVPNLVAEPVVQLAQLFVVGQDGVDVADGPEHPGTDLLLVRAQPEDQVVQRPGHRQRPPVDAGGPGVGRRRSVRPRHRDVGPPCGPVDRGRDEGVRRGVAVLVPGQRCQGDAGATGPGRGRSGRPGPLGHGVQEAGSGHRLVDQPPAHRLLAADPLGFGGEHVGMVLAHQALVRDPGEPAGPRQDPEQRHLGQRHRRGAVVDEHELVAGQGQLVAAAGGGSVDRGDPGLPRVRGGVLDAVAGLVGELAEVHLPGVRRLGQHLDVGAGAEHPVQPAGDDDRLDLGVLETQSLHGVVQLDVHPQVVAVALQLVAGDDPAVRVHGQGEGRDLAVVGQPPVPVAVGTGIEVDRNGHARASSLRCT